MNKEQIDLIVSKIAAANSIAIVGHKNVDPDSLGSVLGLGRLIELNFGKKPILIYDGNVPEYMDFFPGRSDMAFAGKLPDGARYDLLFALDIATPSRQFGDYREKIVGHSDFVIKIDHHQNSEKFGDINIDDDTAGATAEIIFDLAQTAGWKFDVPAAGLLLAAIIHDTGQFAFARRGHTLRVAADLMDAGADMEYLVRELNKSTRRHMMAQANILAAAEFHGNIAIASVFRKDYKNIDGSPHDVIDMLRRIKSVEYVVIVTEAKDGEVRLSFRSKTRPVNLVAEQFEGGGHRFAAGGRFFGSMAEAKAAVIKAIKDSAC